MATRKRRDFTDETKPCRHHRGWVVIENPTLWTAAGRRLAIGSGNGKVMASCNLMCGATRLLYLRGSVKRFGTIHGSGGKPFGQPYRKGKFVAEGAS